MKRAAHGAPPLAAKADGMDMGGRRWLSFTLVEMMVVILVIIVLMAVLLPVVGKSREMSRRTRCAGNLKQIGLALVMYAGDNGAYFPVVANGTTNFGPLNGFSLMEANSPVYACPSSSVSHTLATNTSYKYVGSGLQDENPQPFGVSLSYDASGNHPRNAWMNILFMDSHVEGAQPGVSPQFYLNN